MLHLTPETLEAAYELLRTTAPFKRWKLPDPDTLEFRAVAIANNDQGELWHRADGSFCLTVSPARHKTLHAAIMTLAHEMVHLREVALKSRGNHGTVFNKLADSVCKHHGFDRGQF